MYHADQMPMVEWGLVQVRRGPAGLWELTIEVKNPKVIPSILAWAKRNRIGYPDELICETGPNTHVIASSTVRSLDPWSGMNIPEDQHQPHRYRNESGIGSNGKQMFRFLIEGDEPVTLQYISDKGGSIEMEVPMEETEPVAPPPAPGEDT
jgi:hypothetical protein